MPFTKGFGVDAHNVAEKRDSHVEIALLELTRGIVVDATNSLFVRFRFLIGGAVIEAFEAIFIAQSAAGEAGSLLFDSVVVAVAVDVFVGLTVIATAGGFHDARLKGASNVLA